MVFLWFPCSNSGGIFGYGGMLQHIVKWGRLAGHSSFYFCHGLALPGGKRRPYIKYCCTTGVPRIRNRFWHFDNWHLSVWVCCQLGPSVDHDTAGRRRLALWLSECIGQTWQLFFCQALVVRMTKGRSGVLVVAIYKLLLQYWLIELEYCNLWQNDFGVPRIDILSLWVSSQNDLVHWRLAARFLQRQSRKGKRDKSAL